MEHKKKDFKEVFLYTIVKSGIFLVISQLIINFLYFLINAEPIKLSTNLYFFVTIEIFLLILSLMIAFVYTTWFMEYKKEENGRERKVRKFKSE